MITAGYVFSPHDVPPVQIPPPQNFKNIDLYPSVAFSATRRKVATFCEVVKRDDEHGVCLVSHFQVAGTLVVLYQSALDSRDHWTVFADMHGCVDKQQVPTKLGLSVIRYLTGSIEPDWVNEKVDAVYRSGRRKLSKAAPERVKSLFKATGQSLRRTLSTSRRNREIFTDLPRVAKKAPEADRIRSLASKKDMTPVLSAMKKAATAAPKAAAAKKAAAPKRAAAPKKLAASKK